MKRRSANIVIMILLITSTIEIPINLVLLPHYPSRIGTEERSQANKISSSQLAIANTWSPNGTGICKEYYDQLYPQICSDEAGGAIITWEDERNGINSDIYAQGISSVGDLKWISKGVVICTEKYTQGAPQICSDGAGGAVITWNDKRNGSTYDIYTQKIDTSGDLKWNANGTVISMATEDQVVPQICSDGAGGAIITWTDYRNGKNYDIYAQKINSSGFVKWNANGTAICTEGGDQYFPQICGDGAGGAIITWEDLRGSDSDIYAQYINSTGHAKWTTNGTTVSTANNIQWYPKICSDGARGAIITWADYRSGTNFDIYAQWINSTGYVKLIANGTSICKIGGNQEVPQICSDGTGGAIITWEDSRGFNSDIYAQSINSIGDVKWTTNGVAICIATDDQVAPKICSDGSGGVIITWEDLRSGMWKDIYTQKVNSIGGVSWAIDGVAVCTADLAQRYHQICSDGLGGAIVTWADRREGGHYDIYAHLIKELPLKPEEFPFGIIISIVSILGIIAIGGIITVYILKKRRK